MVSEGGRKVFSLFFEKCQETLRIGGTLVKKVTRQDKNVHSKVHFDYVRLLLSEVVIISKVGPN